MPKRCRRKIENGNVSAILDSRSPKTASEANTNSVNHDVLSDDTVIRSINLSDNWWENVPSRSNSRLLRKLLQDDMCDDTRIISSPFPNWWSHVSYRNLPVPQYSQERRIFVSPTPSNVPATPEINSVERRIQQERFDILWDDKTEEFPSNPMTSKNRPESILNRSSFESWAADKPLGELPVSTAGSNSSDERSQNSSDCVNGKMRKQKVPSKSAIRRKKYNYRKVALFNTVKQFQRSDQNVNTELSEGSSSESKSVKRCKIRLSELIDSDNDSVSYPSTVGRFKDSLLVREPKTGRFQEAFEENSVSTSNQVLDLSKNEKIYSSDTSGLTEDELSLSPSNTQELRRKPQIFIREPRWWSETSGSSSSIVQHRKDFESLSEVTNASIKNTFKTKEPSISKSKSKSSKIVLHDICNKDHLSEILDELPGNKEEFTPLSEVNLKPRSVCRLQAWNIEDSDEMLSEKLPAKPLSTPKQRCLTQPEESGLKISLLHHTEEFPSTPAVNSISPAVSSTSLAVSGIDTNYTCTAKLPTVSKVKSKYLRNMLQDISSDDYLFDESIYPSENEVCVQSKASQKPKRRLPTHELLVLSEVSEDSHEIQNEKLDQQEAILKNTRRDVSVAENINAEMKAKHTLSPLVFDSLSKPSTTQLQLPRRRSKIDTSVVFSSSIQNEREKYQADISKSISEMENRDSVFLANSQEKRGPGESNACSDNKACTSLLEADRKSIRRGRRKLLDPKYVNDSHEMQSHVPAQQEDNDNSVTSIFANRKEAEHVVVVPNNSIRSLSASVNVCAEERTKRSVSPVTNSPSKQSTTQHLRLQELSRSDISNEVTSKLQCEREIFQNVSKSKSNLNNHNSVFLENSEQKQELGESNVRSAKKDSIKSLLKSERTPERKSLRKLLYELLHSKENVTKDSPKLLSDKSAQRDDNGNSNDSSFYANKKKAEHEVKVPNNSVRDLSAFVKVTAGERTKHSVSPVVTNLPSKQSTTQQWPLQELSRSEVSNEVTSKSQCEREMFQDVSKSKSNLNNHNSVFFENSEQNQELGESNICSAKKDSIKSLLKSEPTPERKSLHKLLHSKENVTQDSPKLLYDKSAQWDDNGNSNYSSIYANKKKTEREVKVPNNSVRDLSAFVKVSAEERTKHSLSPVVTNSPSKQSTTQQFSLQELSRNDISNEVTSKLQCEREMFQDDSKSKSKLNNHSSLFLENSGQKEEPDESNIRFGNKDANISLPETGRTSKRRSRLKLLDSKDGLNGDSHEIETDKQYQKEYNDNSRYSSISVSRKEAKRGLSISRNSKENRVSSDPCSARIPPHQEDCESTEPSKTNAVSESTNNDEFQKSVDKKQRKLLDESNVFPLNRNESILFLKSDQNHTQFPLRSPASVDKKNGSSDPKKKAVKSFYGHPSSDRSVLKISEYSTLEGHHSSRMLSVRKSTDNHYSPVVAHVLRRRLFKRAGLLHKGIADHSKTDQVTSSTQFGEMFMSSQNHDSSLKNKDSSLMNMHNSREIANYQDNVIDKSKPKGLQGETLMKSVPRVVNISSYNTEKENPPSASRTDYSDIDAFSSVSEMFHYSPHLSKSNKFKYQEDNDGVKNSESTESSLIAPLRTKFSTSRVLPKNRAVSHGRNCVFSAKYLIGGRANAVSKSESRPLFLEESRQKKDERNILLSKVKSNVGVNLRKLSTVGAQHKQRQEKLTLLQSRKACEKMQNDPPKYADLEKLLAHWQKIADICSINDVRSRDNDLLSNIETRKQDIDGTKAKRAAERLALINKYVETTKARLKYMQENAFGHPTVTVAECKTKSSLNRKQKTSNPDVKIARDVNKATRVKRPPWLHARLYKSLTKDIIAKIRNENKINPMKKAEEIISELVSLISKVLKYRRKGRNPFVDDVVKHLYRSGVIKTPMNYICFCMQYLPQPFIRKVLLDRENDTGILGNEIDKDLNL